MRLLAPLIGVLLVAATAAAQPARPPVPYISGDRAFDEMRRREQQIIRPNYRDETERALSDLYRDPLRKFGYGPKVWATPRPDRQPKAAAPPAYEAYRSLDADRDGFISRQEYFIGRSGVTFAGPAGQARRRAVRRRLDSRFRGADRNRDGRVSAQELEVLADPRF